jgi:cytochrome c
MLLSAFVGALALAAPERPRDVWVFRSVLDGHARMVTLALNKDLWVAYDATHGGLYKAWVGGVRFDGAVYTASHGPQPTSQGQSFWIADPTVTPWSVIERGETRALSPVFRGYRFENGQCTLQYDFELPGGRVARLEETPEFAAGANGPALTRKFTAKNFPRGVEVALDLGFREAHTESTTWNGRWAKAAGGNSAGQIVLGPGEQRLLTVGFLRRDARGEEQEQEVALRGPRAAQETAAPPQEPAASGDISGVAVRIYEVGQDLQRIPTLVSGQTPNRAFVSPTIDFGNDGFRGGNQQILVHVTGKLRFPAAGMYRFRLTSDDGSALWIRDTWVIDHDGLHSASGAEGEYESLEAVHPFRVDYFNNQGDAALRLEWQRPGQNTWEVVPESAFSTPSEVRVTSPGRKSVINAGSRGRPGDRQPLDRVHPSYTLTKVRPADFRPKVGGIDFLPDGQMVVCNWEPDGGVYVLSGVGGDAKDVQVKRIAFGLAEPLGLKVVNGRIYVLQKQELTELRDNDGDGITDEYYALANGWGVTSNFHEFAFGLEYERGKFYANLAIAIDPGGRSTQPQNPDRGKVVEIDARTGKYRFAAQGLRTPNGIGRGYKNQIYITDNQGDWLPSSKLLVFRPDAFYGSQAVDPVGTRDLTVTPPVAWLPQGEIGNSPSQTATLPDGPYAGQMLHGDVTHGGLKRTFVEEVDGVLQGAVFRFTQGLEAGVNRIAWGPDGALYVGGIGSTGNWGQEGKERYGLEKIKYNGRPTFEMLAVRAKANGFEIEFTQPLAPENGNSPDEYEVQSYRYVPTADYGGPKVDEKTHIVKSVSLSADGKRAFLELDGLAEDRVFYFRVNPVVTNAREDDLWSTEAWYTLNRVPRARGTVSGRRADRNGLSGEERREGFVPLFDGTSLDKWRGWRRAELGRGWSIVDGVLSLNSGLGAGDIRTAEEFGDFDLRLDWRVAPGGNSGIFYRVRDDRNWPWETAAEYQLLDNERHSDGRNPLTSAGSNYALYPPRADYSRPAGQWNRTRIVARGNVVEHYLNGRRVVRYEIGSEDWKRRYEESKFRLMSDYAKPTAGYIVLQDHGDPVSFRNIRIKRL